MQKIIFIVMAVENEIAIKQLNELNKILELNKFIIFGLSGDHMNKKK